MDLFRLRLNCVDHYQADPTSFDPELPKIVGNGSTSARPRVPVLRVFGATETGQTVCAHVHGAFPYLYVKYNGSLIPDNGQHNRSQNFACNVTDLTQFKPTCNNFACPSTMH